MTEQDNNGEIDDLYDFKNNCAACGVYDRIGGSRYCDGCHKALVTSD